jgi:cyanophycinase
MRNCYLGLICGLCCACCFTLHAQTFDERLEDWPSELTIHGRLVIVPTLGDARLLADLLGSESFGHAGWMLDPQQSQTTADIAEAKLCYSQIFESLTDLTSTQLTKEPHSPTPGLVVWHRSSASPPGTADASQGPLRACLKSLLTAGKTVILSGPGAALAGKYAVTNPQLPEAHSGHDLMPDCLLQLGFDPAQTQRCLNAVQKRARCVGIGLEPRTVLLLDGRKLQVAGAGRAWLMLPANDWLPSRVETIAARRGWPQPVPEWLADLTEWRRDAIDRTLEEFPPAVPTPPRVERGALLIVGGGALPNGLMQRFVELAGGAAKARLVYVPCAEEQSLDAQASIIEAWQELGVEHTAFFHTKDRHQAHTDEDFLSPLRDATGIWFGGGRQWNLADSYYGTQAHRLMKEVLRSGGVIGGSSAGASIQARYLARATPIENFRIMAPGYERGGLGFLSGVAIDQHFTQRNRLSDMSGLVQRYPQLLGIGIDEATALEVTGEVAEVMGRGGVFFYDRQQAVAPTGLDYIRLEAGQRFNLVERKVVPH